MENRKDELDRFKSEINLGEYACAMHGFILDKRLSSRCSVVVRHSNGDKLIITRRLNRHYVYFNVKGEDSGTILDFIQARQNISLGKIRQKLRAWSAVDSNFSAISTPIVLEPSEHDAGRVLKSWMKANPISACNQYLVEGRRIPFSTIADPIFDGQIRTDTRGNVLFAHRTSDGELSGFEVKNRSFTGFSPGGVKSFFRSNPMQEVTTAVFSESAIDLLSVASIFGTEERQFFSTAGQISPMQLDLSIQTLKAMPSLTTVWLAFDNDPAGVALAERFQAELGRELPSVALQIKLPSTTGSDWNDHLRTLNSPVEKPSL